MRVAQSLWPRGLVHGILQARILEWVAFPFSRGSSWPRNRTGVSCIAGRFFTNWAIREAWGSLPAEDFPELTLRQNDCGCSLWRLSHVSVDPWRVWSQELMPWVVRPRPEAPPGRRPRLEDPIWEWAYFSARWSFSDSSQPAPPSSSPGQENTCLDPEGCPQILSKYSVLFLIFFGKAISNVNSPC